MVTQADGSDFQHFQGSLPLVALGILRYPLIFSAPDYDGNWLIIHFQKYLSDDFHSTKSFPHSSETSVIVNMLCQWELTRSNLKEFFFSPFDCIP